MCLNSTSWFEIMMENMCCYNCKYYSWYYDHCEKHNCKTESKELCSKYEYGLLKTTNVNDNVSEPFIDVKILEYEVNND